MINTNQNFRNLVEKCLQTGQYVGLGNPNARILFIGKEAGMNSNSKIIDGSAQSWLNGNDYSIHELKDADIKLKNKNHTWQRYQKLFELIFFEHLSKDEFKKKDNYEITFVNQVFTTELSNLPATNTRDAKKLTDFKTELQRRKEIFWTDEFIQQFPIVVITAADPKYIETFPGEVCKMFDVEFTPKPENITSEKIWIHYAVQGKSKVYPKLVIHTRQLTNGAKNQLIEELAIIIREFIKKHALEIAIK